MTGALATLVFVHGGFCDASDWSPCLALLGLSFPVVAKNLPGHGGAPLPHEPTIAALAEALRVSIKRTPRVVLVGHSLGCAVVVEAQAGVSNVVGLVLIEGGMGASAELGRTRAALQTRVDALGMDAFLSSLAETWFNDAQLRSKARERLVRLDPEFAKALLLDAMRWEAEDAGPTLAAVSVPMLAVQTTTPGSNGRRGLVRGETTPWLDLIQARAPNARVRVLEGTGHFPHLEDGAAISAIIARFARELVPA